MWNELTERQIMACGAMVRPITTELVRFTQGNTATVVRRFKTKLFLKECPEIPSVPVNGTVRLTGTSLLNLLTGLPLTGLLVNRTMGSPVNEFCVLGSH